MQTFVFFFTNFPVFFSFREKNPKKINLLDAIKKSTDNCFIQIVVWLNVKKREICKILDRIWVACKRKLSIISMQILIIYRNKQNLLHVLTQHEVDRACAGRIGLQKVILRIFSMKMLDCNVMCMRFKCDQKNV